MSWSEEAAELVRRNTERIERVEAMLAEMRAQWAQVNVEATGGDGDVVLAVNHAGRLTALSLAEGCTVRYTHLALEELLNSTLREAVKAAKSEADAIGDAVDIGGVAAQAFRDHMLDGGDAAQ